MSSRILQEVYESAKAQYEIGTMPRVVYLNIKRLYEAEKAETKSENN